MECLMYASESTFKSDLLRISHKSLWQETHLASWERKFAPLGQGLRRSPNKEGSPSDHLGSGNFARKSLEWVGRSMSWGGEEFSEHRRDSALRSGRRGSCKSAPICPFIDHWMQKVLRVEQASEWHPLEVDLRTACFASHDSLDHQLRTPWFLKKPIICIYLAVPGLSCSICTLDFGQWDLVPWPGMLNPGPCIGSTESWPPAQEVPSLLSYCVNFWVLV